MSVDFAAWKARFEALGLGGERPSPFWREAAVLGALEVSSRDPGEGLRIAADDE